MSSTKSNKSDDEKKQEKAEYYKKWIANPVNHEKQVAKLKEKISCECGKKYSYVNKNTHLKTRFHMKFLASQNVKDEVLTDDYLINKFSDIVRGLTEETLTEKHKNVIKLIQELDKLQNKIQNAIMNIIIDDKEKAKIEIINNEPVLQMHTSLAIEEIQESNKPVLKV